MKYFFKKSEKKFFDIKFWSGINNEKENIILFPLRREKYKGADIILSALDKVRQELVNFKFVGFGNLDKSKVPIWIEYYKEISNDNLRVLYSKSKIFVLPSRVEGFPLVNLEAMANRCAVISTKFEGYETYLVNCLNAMLVENENIDELAKTIVNLSRDDILIKKLGLHGKKTAMNYSEDNMVSEFIKIIDTN